MGRGKHLKHKHKTIQVSVRFPAPLFADLIKHTPILENGADYLRNLAIQDLNGRQR